MMKNREQVHTLPIDFKKALSTSSGAEETWKDITSLARNEWICWIISAKQKETRERRITRAIENLTKGKRRPCCWAGCPHR